MFKLLIKDLTLFAFVLVSFALTSKPKMFVMFFEYYVALMKRKPLTTKFLVCGADPTNERTSIFLVYFVEDFFNPAPDDQSLRCVVASHW